MIIEFVGIPGSGKTYISNKLNHYLKGNFPNQKVVHNKDLFHKIKKNGKLKAIKNLIPILFKLSFYKMLFHILIGKASYKQKKQLIIIFLIRLLMYKEIEKKQSQDYIFVLDEGFSHFSISYFRQQKIIPNQGDFNQFFAKIDILLNYHSFYKYYIFIDSHVDKNYQRIEKRSKGWPQGTKEFSYDNKIKYLNKNLEVYQAVKTFITRKEKNLIIDNTTFIRTYDGYFNEVFHGEFNL